MNPSPSPDGGGLLPSGHQWDFSQTGITWLDTLIDAAVVAMILLGAGLAAYARFVHPHIKAIRANSEQAAEDAAEARRQTQNAHADAPYPNLRDNLDANQLENRTANSAILQALDNMAQAQVRMEQAQVRMEKIQARQDKEIGRINDTLLAEREALRKDSEHLAQHARDQDALERRVSALESRQKDP